MELAQAAALVTAGPPSPNSIETWQEAMFIAMRGTKNGLTRPEPRRAIVSVAVAMVVTPPPPLLITAATRSRSTSPRSRPESSKASRAATTAIWAKRAMRLAALGSMRDSGSKSSTSAAIWTFSALGS